MWKVLCIVVGSFMPTTKEVLGVYNTYEEACENQPQDEYYDNGARWKDVKYCVVKCK